MSSLKPMVVGEGEALLIEGSAENYEQGCAANVTRDQAYAIVELAARLDTVDPNFRPKVDGSLLKLGQCVGALSVPGLSLIVRPKVETNSKGKLLDDKQGMLDLSVLLGAAETLQLPNLEFSVPGPVDEGMLLRYADVFTKDLLLIMEDGLRSGYVDLVEGVSSVRGRMVFNSSLTFDRPHLVTCAYQQFITDTLINQVLKRAVALVDGLVSLIREPEFNIQSRTVRGRCRQLSDLFNNVSDNELRWSDVAGIEISRLDRRFASVLRFAQLIIKCNAPTQLASAVGSNRFVRAGFSYLWDVKKLFERYVYDYLSQWAKDDVGALQLGLEIKPQDSTFQVLNKNSNFLHPDMVVYSMGKPVLIIDTKWKRLPINFKGIDRNDTYQMLAYAMTYSCASDKRADAVPVCLLYPAIGKASDPRSTQFKGTNSEVAIAACPMDRKNRNFDPYKVFGHLWPQSLLDIRTPDHSRNS